MQTKWIRAATVAVALSSTGMLASAGTVTLTGWTFGTSWNTVQVTSPPAPNSGAVYAGGFTGSLSGFGAPFDGSPFNTYCVELTQHFSFSNQALPGNYSIVTPAAYFAHSGEWAPDPAPIANRIGQLITYVNANPNAVDTSGESTSLQLAIWNSIYDGDNSLSAGTFTDTSGYAGYATTLLENSKNTLSNLNVYVLASGTNQDFLVTTRVPEPGTLALAAAGFAGLGFSARRRRAQSSS